MRSQKPRVHARDQDMFLQTSKRHMPEPQFCGDGRISKVDNTTGKMAKTNFPFASVYFSHSLGSVGARSMPDVLASVERLRRHIRNAQPSQMKDINTVEAITLGSLREIVSLFDYVHILFDTIFHQGVFFSTNSGIAVPRCVTAVRVKLVSISWLRIKWMHTRYSY